MSARHYRLCALIAASVSLALLGCRAAPPAPPRTAGAPPPAPQTAENTRQMDTDATIWTFLHIRKEHKSNPTGPHVGPNVSPILWVAAHDTLDFVRTTSEDPLLGRMVTDWYSPPDKPDERFRVAVDIMAPYLRSDAVAVHVERQTRSPDGSWQDASVDKKLDDDLTFAILNRARAIRTIVAETYKK
jgi:hypothetical protein